MGACSVPSRAYIVINRRWALAGRSSHDPMSVIYRRCQMLQAPQKMQDLTKNGVYSKGTGQIQKRKAGGYREMARVLTGERLEKELARLEGMLAYEREYAWA